MPKHQTKDPVNKFNIIIFFGTAVVFAVAIAFFAHKTVKDTKKPAPTKTVQNLPTYNTPSAVPFQKQSSSR